MIEGMQTEAAADGGYRELVQGVAIASGDGWSRLLVKGEDRLAWLHGQTTQDVAGMLDGEVREACVCAPTGQILATLTLAERNGSTILILPRASEQVILDLAERTIFMEDASVIRPPSNWVPTLVQGPQSTRAIREAGIEPEDPSITVIPFRAAGDGYAIWADPEQPEVKILQRAHVLAAPEALAAARIEAGIPDWALELSGKVLPPELGPAFVQRTVSYQKGCYTGQEVLMRIHARGHTNRTWVALVCEAPVSTGSKIRSETRESAGVVTSTAVSPEFGPIAAAFLHNDSAQPQSRVSVVTSLGEVSAEVREMPLRT